MDQVTAKLTILFVAPFWIGVYERQWKDFYEVCKITFGSEPKDYEVYEFLQKNGRKLIFAIAENESVSIRRHINPKRLQREVRRSTAMIGVGTKAQQVLQQQREAGRLENKVRKHEMHDADKLRRLALRQEKHKQKHRGH